uniref:Putative secreted protein n=1 Tax=Anopheles darlingi TaxID=43151 RepID=A0A2M4D1I2_ANODA
MVSITMEAVVVGHWWLPSVLVEPVPAWVVVVVHRYAGPKGAYCSVLSPALGVGAAVAKSVNVPGHYHRGGSVTIAACAARKPSSITLPVCAASKHCTTTVPRIMRWSARS